MIWSRGFMVSTLLAFVLALRHAVAFTPLHGRLSLWGLSNVATISSPVRNQFGKITSDEDLEEIFDWDPDSGEQPIVIRGSDADDIDGAIWEDLETGEPPKWMVMKELLGINIFSYVLAAFIAFFLGMNFFLGPGWLGGVLGIEGTGSINEVSDSFPDVLDLSSPDYRL